MVDNDKELAKSEQPDQSYDELATNEPVRGVELPPDPEGGGEKSFSDREEDFADITDMQAVMLRLFPKQATRTENLAMVSRIHPDVFLPLINMAATSEIMSMPDDAKIDVVSIYSKYYSLFSIGLDGRGRIDALELGGAARDTKIKDGKETLL